MSKESSATVIVVDFKQGLFMTNEPNRPSLSVPRSRRLPSRPDGAKAPHGPDAADRPSMFPLPAHGATIVDHPALRAGAASAAEPDASSPTGNDVADYIAQLASELAALAAAQRLDVLAYFLDMAAVEAAAMARKGACR